MLEFIVTILFVYLIYYVWIIANFDKAGNPIRMSKKKNSKKSIEKKMPAEVKLFVYRYNVDLDKINYRYFLQIIGLIVAIDIAAITNIIVRVNVLWLQIVLVLILIIIFTLVSFEILGRYFKKKGLTKDENNKRNRK